MNNRFARSARARRMHDGINFEISPFGRASHFFLERNILRECFFNMQFFSIQNSMEIVFFSLVVYKKKLLNIVACNIKNPKKYQSKFIKY